MSGHSSYDGRVGRPHHHHRERDHDYHRSLVPRDRYGHEIEPHHHHTERHHHHHDREQHRRQDHRGDNVGCGLCRTILWEAYELWDYFLLKLGGAMYKGGL